MVRRIGWGSVLVASALLACGDDGSNATTSTTTGPSATSSTTDASVGGSSTAPGGGSTSGEDTTGMAPGSTSSSGDSTGGGGALPDPEVYRTPDVAPVCAPTPQDPCTPSDMVWVAAEYGSEVTRADDAWVDAQGAVYRLVAFVERVGPSNIDVVVLDEAGAPIPDLPVAFYYDSLDTPSRPDEWYPVKIEALTNAEGRAGFALGGGAYLPDCGAGGPHAIWVSEPGRMPDTTVASDLADHLGMLGGTEHRHLDLLFQRVGPGARVGPGQCPLGG